MPEPSYDYILVGAGSAGCVLARRLTDERVQNLRDRVQWKSDLAEAERTSLEEVLPRAAAALGDGPGAPMAERIRSALATDAPTRDQELAAVFLETLAALDELPEEVAAAGRAVLGGHLAAHAVREVLPLKPSLLREISEG